MTLAIISHSFAYEMECVVRIFYPGEKITVVDTVPTELADTIITAAAASSSGTAQLSVRVQLGDFVAQQQVAFVGPVDTHEAECQLARLLFDLLCQHTGRRPSWGILTGVRPVRLCHNLAQQRGGWDQALRAMESEFLVEPAKAQLALATAQQQQPILHKNQGNVCSLYISIPFCPSRCNYCSFVSHSIEKAAAMVPQYVELLCRELQATAALVQRLGLRLQTVYMGGGTPTTLNPAQLAQILETVRQHFDLSELLEYTVEAGRPDTITREKLETLRAYDVGRISINPQTLSDEILTAIGRRHTAQQVLDSYHLAREVGFAQINMDLIAGLTGESAANFEHTLDQVIELAPENITVHTLTVKRASTLRGQGHPFAAPDLDIESLLSHAYHQLGVSGYRPYYLYRQKGTLQNLENTGFSMSGHASIYNVYSMEDVHTILAVGAGGVTKLCHPSGKLERVFNFKYPYEYADRFDEVLARKSVAEEFYERDHRK